jgi:hypothetical protein
VGEVLPYQEVGAHEPVREAHLRVFSTFTKSRGGDSSSARTDPITGPIKKARHHLNWLLVATTNGQELAVHGGLAELVTRPRVLAPDLAELRLEKPA